MARPTADAMLRKMEAQALRLGTTEMLDSPLLKRQAGVGRWQIDPRWITFECGCVAERVTTLRCPQAKIDAVIFDDAESREFLSVYATVCRDRYDVDANVRYHHETSMNTRVGAGVAPDVFGRTRQFRDFSDWYTHRRPLLMGAT